MKKVLKIIGGIILALVIVLALALGVLTITEYRPAATETVTADHPVPAVLKAGDPMTMVIWNIGYGAGIRETLAGLDADIIALQEVDIGSDRSYRTDEREALRDVIPGGSEAFAYNFNSLFVPYPLPPIGHVESGLVTLSRAEAREAERISLPCPFSWPLRIANLKRCLLVSRIPVEAFP